VPLDLLQNPTTVAFALVFLFVVGASIGSFLNVCIARLPWEKSLLWPSSRCGHCLQAIAWYDNIPLLSYWILRGRCRICRQPFSLRYFLVELCTAVGLAGLYYLEVVVDVQHLRATLLARGPAIDLGGLYVTRYDVGRLVIFAYHSVLFCFLLTAAVCDLDQQAVPLSLTLTGTVIGIIGAVFLAWPWPYPPALLGANPNFPPVQGVYPWPVWYPLPGWLKPGGNWQTGLATGLAGALAGTLIVRAVRFLFGLGAGAAYAEEELPQSAAQPPRWIGGRLLAWMQGVGGKAMGLGDADLMMMAGAFLGWQAIIIAFFVSVLPGLFFGLATLFLRGNRAMPFVPALALGVMVTCLWWSWIGPRYELFFFNGVLLGFVFVAGCVGMVLAALLIRVMRALRGA